MSRCFAFALLVAVAAAHEAEDVWDDLDDMDMASDTFRHLQGHKAQGSGSGSMGGSAAGGSGSAAPAPAPVSPTPAPTLAAGTKAVVFPTKLTGFSVAEFKGGLQFAFRKSIAALTKVDISKVVISNVRAGSRRRLNEGRRLAAADIVKFDVKIQVADAAAATAMTTSVKAITTRNLKNTFVAEAKKVKAGTYGTFTGDPINNIDIAAREAAIKTKPNTALIKTETVVAPAAPTPAPPAAAASSGVGAIVGGVVGAIVVGGGAWYFMNNKGKGSVTPS